MRAETLPVHRISPSGVWLRLSSVVHKPRLLSDNGSSYVSRDLAEWLQNKGMKHSRGASYHSQTLGKIERWHQTSKNLVLLENYFLPGDLEAQIEAFVVHCNHQRYQESTNNVTPADVYFGRDKAILKQRERTKRKKPEARRLHHRQHAALSNQQIGPNSLRF
jgi:putative transposase